MSASDDEARPAATVVKMSMFGTVPEFNPKEDWGLYVEQLEQYFIANEVAEAKRAAVLLTVIGPTTYKILRNLCDPVLPKDKTFAELCELLKRHYEPQLSTFKERREFYDAKQNTGESINDWFARLKCLAIHCKFGAQLEPVLRDKFVTGITNSKILDRLCEEEGTASLRDVVSIAVKREGTIKGSESKEVHRLKGQFPNKRRTTQKVSQPTTQTSSTTAPQKDREKSRCYACGETDHNFKTCKYKKYKCKSCDKVGHLTKVCSEKSKKHNFLAEEEAEKSESEAENSESETSNNSELEMYKVSSSKAESMKIRLFVNDKELQMEIDTGAAISAISREMYEKRFSECELQETEMILSSYTGEKIQPRGVLQVMVKHGNITKELKLYVVDQGGPPLIGRDWINAFDLVEIKVAKINKLKDEMSELTEEFKEVFSPGLGKYKFSKIKLEVEENTRPIFCRPRKLPLIFKEKVEQELERLAQEGVITRIDDSEWGTPLVPVLKKDGNLRLCADYRATVNKSLKDFKFPLPRIEELFAALQGGVQFTKLDLSQAYNQLELDEDSKKLITWSTHKGIFAMNRLPFGTKPACAIFQHIMEKTLQGCKGVINFIDDVVITGADREEHLRNLRAVLGRLKEAGFKVKKEKCEFFKPEIKYLGHIINAEGLQKDTEKIDAVLLAQVPTNQTQVRAFTGMVNYYARFLPNLAQVMRPLYDLLSKETEFKWTKRCEESFTEAKRLVASDRVLVHYNPTFPIKVTCDASNDGIGAVLSHVDKDNNERPVAFTSRVLSQAEKNYSNQDKEALAVYNAVRKFENYLAGRKFILETDNKPLVSTFSEKKGIPHMATGRLQRWAVYLSSFDYQIKHIKGSENTRADCLSRLPLKEKGHSNNEGNYLNFLNNESELPLDAGKIGIETRKDPIFSRVLEFVNKGWPKELNLEEELQSKLQPFFIRKNELTVEQGVIMWGYRVAVPEKFRRQLLEELHNSHVGIVKMKAAARSIIWWPNLDKEIEALVNACDACELSRADPPLSKLTPWPEAEQVFERVHIDYLGPIEGYMFLILVDAYSKWVEVCRMKTITTEKTTEKLREIFSRFGIPKLLVSDNGRQFVSQDFEQFCKLNGIKHKTSVPYHPATNGAAENSVKTFKSGLQKMLSDKKNSGLSLDSLVNRHLFSYRNGIVRLRKRQLN